MIIARAELRECPHTGQGLAALREVSAACLSPAGQLQVATALEVTEALEARLHAVRHQLLDAARHLAGAKVLAARLYGIGPFAALAMTCWLGGEGRFSSSRQAVRFAGLDVTVWSSDRKGPPGRLSRQGPLVAGCGGVSGLSGPEGERGANGTRPRVLSARDPF